MQRVGKGLSAAINAYNGAVGSLESRVLVSARRFKDLGAAAIGAEIDEVLQIETSSRLLQAPELLCNKDGSDELPRQVPDAAISDDS